MRARLEDSPAVRALVEQHHEDDRHAMAEDIRKVMSTKEGRRILIAIMFQGGVYAHSKTADNLAYVAGRRDAALEVMKDCNEVAADLVLQARLERHQLISERNKQVRELMNHEAQKQKETT